MKRINRIIAIATFCWLTVSVALGDPAQPELDNPDPQPAASEIAANERGPHGQHDPHASLGPDAMIKVALQHQREGRPALALQTLDEAIDRHARHAELRAIRGSVLLSMGRVARALKDLELAVKWKPDDPKVLTNRAQAYRGFGREQEAFADLDRALEMDPDLLAARFNRGAMRHARGDYQGALNDFDHCVAVDPHSPAAYFNRAATYEALGRRKEAIADIGRFRELTDNPQWRKTADELLKAWGDTPSSAEPDVPNQQALEKNS